ncbi:MAG: hypothetical protein WC817_01185 [Patescibacteria group bacterium]
MLGLKENASIPGSMQLLREAAALYRKQFGRLIALLLAAIFAVIVGIFVLLGMLSFTSWLSVSSTPTVHYIGLALSILIEVAAFIALGITQLWASLTVVVTLAKGADSTTGGGIIDAYRESRRFVLPYLWVSILSGLLMLGGVLLLVVPGIILSVWFILALYVVVSEDRHGFTALLASREYVRGRWWAVAGRIVVLALLSFVISIPGAILTGVFNQPGIAQAINFALELLLTPLLLGYFYVLYLRLKTLPVAVAPESNVQLRKYLVVGSVVMAFLTVILVAAMFIFGAAALQGS